MREFIVIDNDGISSRSEPPPPLTTVHRTDTTQFSSINKVFKGKTMN